MWILQGYILRELLKTFVLSAVALTAILSLGGGIVNVVAAEGVTTADLARVLHLLIPIIATVTMPAAALFAAALVYGRHAADNEFVAARAAGINVHKLFLPALLLAVFLAAFTIAFANYVMPEAARQLEVFIRTNVAEIAHQRLSTRGHVHIERDSHHYLMTAASASMIPADAMAQRGFPTGPGYSYLRIDEPTVLEIDGSRTVRFITGRLGICQFDRTGDTVQATLIVDSARDYEAGRQSIRLERQAIGPYPLPIPMPSQMSFASLDRLFEWLREPWTHEQRVGGNADKLILAVMEERFASRLQQEFDAHGGRITLPDDRGQRYDLTAGRLTVGRSTGRPLLSEAQVLFHKSDAPPIRYQAPSVEVIARPQLAGPTLVELRLRGAPANPVLEFNPRNADPNRPLEKPSLSLDFVVPADALPLSRDLTRAGLIAGPDEFSLSPRLAERHAGLRAQAAEFRRSVLSMIHFRLGLSGSVLVTIPIAAALGVIFRGGRALAAIGLSFLPSLAVACVLFVGRKLGSEIKLPPEVGLSVIWGSLAAFGVALLAILRVGVRR